MSTKEISAITYQSYNTLSTARYRLRKKLGLDDHANLVSFLAQL
jgi:DNA-binding CsgD family transcriptional regulator